jgi:hypothetical protein
MRSKYIYRNLSLIGRLIYILIQSIVSRSTVVTCKYVYRMSYLDERPNEELHGSNMFDV